MSTETDLTTVIAPEASPVAVAQAEIVQESAPAETSEPAPAESVAVAETSPAIEEQKDATPAAEAEAETPAEPIYSGVLSKCGGALSIWRKRFFIFKSEATSAEQLMRLAKKAHAKKNADETFAVLAAATIRGDGLLFYFESDAQTETPLGVIALSDITEVKSTASPAFGFTLVVGKREYALGASTDAERQGWLKAIEEKRAEAATLADLSDNESFKTAFAAFKASYTPKDLKLKRKLFGKKATKVAETTTGEESSADETPAAIEAPKGEVTEEVAPVVEVAEKEEAVVAEAVKVEAPETVAEVPAIEEEVQESPKVEQEKIEGVQEVEKVEEKPTVEEESVQEQPTEEKTEEPVAPVEEIAAETTDDTPKDDASTSAKSNKLEHFVHVSRQSLASAFSFLRKTIKHRTSSKLAEEVKDDVVVESTEDANAVAEEEKAAEEKVVEEKAAEETTAAKLVRKITLSYFTPKPREEKPVVPEVIVTDAAEVAAN